LPFSGKQWFLAKRGSILPEFTLVHLAVVDVLLLLRANGYDRPAFACIFQDEIADAGESGIPALALRVPDDIFGLEAAAQSLSRWCRSICRKL
jgi:hypothetical protein